PAYEQVEVAEAPKRGLRIVDVRDRRTFQDAEVEADCGEPIGDREEQPFEQEGDDGNLGLQGRGLLDLRIGCGERAVENRGREQSGEALVGHLVEKRAPRGLVERRARECAPRSGESVRGDGVEDGYDAGDREVGQLLHSAPSSPSTSSAPPTSPST